MLQSKMTYNQYYNSFNYNLNYHHNISQGMSNVFNNKNNRTLPLPIKNTPYSYEEEYAILALNSKRVYKATYVPKVLSTMNYDNINKTIRSESTSLAEVNLNKEDLLTLKNKNQENNSSEKKKRINMNTKYNLNNKCKVCEKVCQSPSALKIHMAIHSDGKPFKCFFCDKFISKFASNRNRHMKQVHQWDNKRKD